jgi:hypothetical protein
MPITPSTFRSYWKVFSSDSSALLVPGPGATMLVRQSLLLRDAGARGPQRSLWEAITATLRAVTKLGGGVELVAPASLPNDGKVIVDERG